ncbi:MAG TPA: hypothetical protein VMF86_08765 [Stellaceae bacterium]|nr:hypothetical protein [Stellaceae bacterium]
MMDVFYYLAKIAWVMAGLVALAIPTGIVLAVIVIPVCKTVWKIVGAAEWQLAWLIAKAQQQRDEQQRRRERARQERRIAKQEYDE